MHELLTSHLNAPRWHIAFSGGLDSTVLLHKLVELSRQQTLPALHAVHIHHGLQAAADAWPAHCQTVCDALGVPLTLIHVQVQPGASLEQAARLARYAAFEQVLGVDDVLLTAQHGNDQAETLLFRLLRGAGVRGLAGMPSQRALGQGWLVRPLLGESRAQLEAYAREYGLRAIEDPSNQDLRYSRNYLRQQVVPVLEQRWPQATATIARSAGHLREALNLLDELAMEDLRAATAPGTFDWLGLPSLLLGPLAALSTARQRNALQHWLAPLTRLPDSVHWQGWEDFREAGASARPIWALGDGQIHRGAGRLWWLAPLWQAPTSAVQPWIEGSGSQVLPGNGEVRLAGARPAGRLQIGYRQGGETLALPGRGRRDLKRLLNETGLPAFARGRLPLLFVDGQLQAVANFPGLSASEARLDWLPPTNAQRLR
ncbi:tRNA lysidine(34) synthetase TilS [Pseudomonas sp. dw_358]|uniref:tRNA lysidine(34) synthetase TilS n=1 Tax=Pseudomonas sp. dw_358 TaxID=2720083 RepID=UPI001BD6A702|nr:tRNA lysidine(34) synthetase TilS [Pseudomonas sp. dw_358]